MDSVDKKLFKEDIKHVKKEEEEIIDTPSPFVQHDFSTPDVKTTLPMIKTEENKLKYEQNIKPVIKEEEEEIIDTPSPFVQHDFSTPDVENPVPMIKLEEIEFICVQDHHSEFDFKDETFSEPFKVDEMDYSMSTVIENLVPIVKKELEEYSTTEQTAQYQQATSSQEITNKVSDNTMEYDKHSRKKMCSTSRESVEGGRKVGDMSDDDGDMDEVIINKASKKENGTRFRNKHCCKFCNKMYISISRHIILTHKEELEIAKVLALKDHERRRELKQIVREGDYYYNKEVLTSGKGELILVRRPTAFELKTHTFQDYGPCTTCLGFMLKEHMWHHAKYTCPSSGNKKKNPFSVRFGCEALLAAGTRDTYSEEYEQWVVGRLYKDEIGLLCKKEELILKYGNFLFHKNLVTNCQQRAQIVRSSMRALVTVYMKFKEKHKILSFSEVLDPVKFDLMVDTVKEIYQYQNISKKGDLISPSSAIRLGLELVKIGEFVHGIYIKQKDTIKENRVKKFIHLVRTEWNTRVSGTARSISSKGSRVLLSVDKGKRGKFAGKNLANDMSDLDSEEEEEIHIVSEGEQDSDKSEYYPKEAVSVAASTKKVQTTRKNCSKTPWTTKEKTVVLKFFRDTIRRKVGVKKIPAEQCISENNCLKGRSWLNVRDFVRNYIRKL